MADFKGVCDGAFRRWCSCGRRFGGNHRFMHDFYAAETAAVQTETAADISWTPWLELLMRCFCFGAVGSVTGLWLSSAVNNRYMAWIGPFMAMYLLVILYERYFSQYPVIYPREWLALTMGWPWNGWSACVFMLLLTLLAAWAFYQSADRRLKNV